MTRSKRILSALAAISVLAMASPVSSSQHSEISSDRQKVIDHLQRTRKEFLASIDGVSEAQWKFKAAPDRWSIAEVAEHITLSETLIEGMVSTELAKATPGDTRSKYEDDQLAGMITNRTNKFQAPEVLKPASKFATREILIEAFEEARGKTLASAKMAKGDLRALMIPNPVLGEMDGQQGFLFLSSHTARHIAQIEEVKKSEGYPAK